MFLLGSSQLSPSPLGLCSLTCGTASVLVEWLLVALARPGSEFVPSAPRRLNINTWRSREPSREHPTQRYHTAAR